MLRHNLVRDEEHKYTYDARGNMTSNGRTKFYRNDDNQLIQAVFPDGEGVSYTYDAMGRRISKTTFNAQHKGLHTTWYDYEGSSWNVARERNKDGDVVASYTYDLEGRPLTITYQGATYWYVYNAHGDVVALTDLTGAVKARYEYDEWGRLEAMYDETGRVREGYGTISDIGTGPTRPVIGSPTPGSGNGKPKKNAPSPDEIVEPVAPEEPESGDEGELQVQGLVGEPDDLVKVNPYRYGGYRYDRETQYYYLRARNYDARLGRFLSQDTWAGDVSRPLTLNRYIYALGNPVNYLDPTGHVISPCPEGCDTTRWEGRFDSEDELFNLVNKSEEEILRQFGFSQDAITYYGVDFLIDLVGYFGPPDVKVMNQSAKVYVAEGRTYGDGSLERDARRNSSEALSWTPWVGDVKDFQEMATGTDLMTGEQLEGWERGATAAAFVIPLVPGKAVRRVLNRPIKWVSSKLPWNKVDDLPAGKLQLFAGPVDGTAGQTLAHGVETPEPPAAPKSLSNSTFTKASSPTGRTVYQRGDIDWGLVRPVKVGGRVKMMTNAEAALGGFSPMRVGPNGKFEGVQLHHANQDYNGAFVELWSSTHARVPHKMVPSGGSWRNTPGLEQAYNAERALYWKWRSPLSGKE
jgi:RHS repeat-associated protein